jgi:AraC-like DNA-binding protein
MGEAVLKHTVLEPSAALRPFVKRFESIHSFTERIHTLLPDTSLVACFRLGGVALDGASALPAAGISGLQSRARTVTHLAGSHVLLTVFTEAGATAFLREPLDRLLNRTIPIECLLRRSQLNEVQEQLMETGGLACGTGVLERFLLAQLRAEAPDPVTEAAVKGIQKRHGTLRIEKLAPAMGLSLSALERRFRKNVGTSPRRFASIVRMRHVLRLRKTGQNLTEIAYRAGYCDQSHFIKDFKNFTGSAPELFFRQIDTFC